ncbi:MAG: GAF domain-containing protein [Pseudolabrys sp.]
MRRRRKGGGQPAKGRRHSTVTPRARKAPTGRISAADLQEKLAKRTRELDEALQQQTATREVLSIIRRSPADAQPVFDAIVESAARLCDAVFSVVYLYEANLVRVAATKNFTPDATTQMNKLQQFKRPDRSHAGGRAILDRAIVHVPDVRADPEYSRELALAGGWRAVLAVPLLRNGTPVGALSAAKAEPKPFSDRQIQLLKTFADQALIAIENVRLFETEQQRSRELRESLQQQTATADVLKVISGSAFELQTVFNTLVESAMHLCEAEAATIWRPDGNVFKLSAHCGFSREFEEFCRQNPITPGGRGTVTARVAFEGKIVHVPDVLADPQFAGSEYQMRGNYRSALGIPLLRKGETIGVFVLTRPDMRPYTDKQIELVKTFADQAVIAIENVRLFDELRESLQQQTATADVLKVISSTPGDLQPVFDTMLAKATDLCQASYGTMWLSQADGFRTVAMYGGLPPAWVEQWRSGTPYRPLPNRPLARVAESRQPIQITDLRDDQSYLEGDPLPVAAVEIAGIRTLLVVPMFKESELVGAIAIYRKEVRPFTDKQIALVTNFAAQAVIAIENTRLLSELRESLQQQTATADVLKVISSSAGELQPVFEAVLENATRLCAAKFGNLYLCEGDAFRTTAMHNVPPAFAEVRRRDPLVHPEPGSLLRRLVDSKKPVHIPDVTVERAYIERQPRHVTAVELGGFRSILGVPMLKDRSVVGAIVIYRQEISTFFDKQIELVQNFAAQAVIAIENTRLLNELRESLQQQTATADVLKVISRSTFDLRTVLQTLVESAATLCDADKGNITREKDGVFYRAAESYGYSREFVDHIRGLPIESNRGSATGRALFERRVIHIPDVRADPEYTLVDAQRLGDYRSVLAVPMLREGVALGVLTLSRSEVRPFTDKQIELVSTFADQAAIAIENVRLFESVEARTRELAASLENLRTTQDRLVQTQKLASLGQLTAGIAHEIKNPLNFVNNFSGVSAELIDELQNTLKGISLDNKARAEITELTDTLRGNLEKVVQHGERADAIVKNMLLHSREGSGEHRVVDINAIVEESLNLAYHGARAEKQGFNISLERSLDPATGEVDVFPQDITRVLLNLIANGFYAATKRKAQADSDGYEPTLAVATKSLGDRVEIRIRDNGTGIPPEVKEKIFNPFFTTKPAGEGTGLGLSISHDIIVKQHGGSIEVDTLPGEFTEIRIVLPRAALGQQ